MAIPLISKELRKMMAEAVKKWEEYAKQTPYNWDNMVVDALKGILSIEKCEDRPIIEQTIS